MVAELKGRVEGIYLIPKDKESLPSEVEEVGVDWAGFQGDKYYSLTMKAGSSQKPYEKGTEVRNTRQISIISDEEMAQVAEDMDLPRIDAAWVKANLVLSGIPQLSKLPPGSRLHFEDGTGLVVEEENKPCTTAGGIIQSNYPDRERLTQEFPKRALGRRGLVAWVERPGRIRRGDSVLVRVLEVAAYPGT